MAQTVRIPAAGYNTQLSPLDEMAYRQWVKDNNVPTNPDATAPQDYDMRGFWQGLQQQNPRSQSAVDPNDSRLHYPDFWKTPLHQTISNESQWAPANAPSWTDDDKLVSPSGRVVFDDRNPPSDADKLLTVPAQAKGGRVKRPISSRALRDLVFRKPMPAIKIKKRKHGGRVRDKRGRFADGGSVDDDMSDADKAAMSPETYVNPVAKNLVGSLATLPQRAIQNSQYSLDTGNYDPGPTLEAATLPMGTGAIAGVPVRGGEAVLGAGPIRAYHGSPHDFDAFDLSKIGTGEGAQAYGHGLYFADAEKVAEQYRNKLSDAGYARVNGGLTPKEEYVYDKMTGGASEMDVLKDYASRYGGSFDDAMATVDKVKGLNKGRMYQVDINADPEHFLDWDNPMSQQSQAVKDALGLRMTEQLGPSGYLMKSDKLGGWQNPDNTGGAFYQSSKLVPGDFRDKVAASNRLNEAGIPGIKYLDQGSRSAGEGSRNYVVFNDKLISILKKYGIAGAAATQMADEIMDQGKQHFASGGRVGMADGGTPNPFDEFDAHTASPGATSANPFDEFDAGATPPPDNSLSGRVGRMWEKATPGGPLWMVKQAVEGAKGAVQSSADVMSTPGTETEADAYLKNLAHEQGPGYAAQAAQVLTPGAPGGTGGLLAAPLRAAEKIVSPIVEGNKAAAGEFGINLSRGQSAGDLDAIRYEDMASRGAYGPEQQQRAAAFFNQQHQDIEAGGQSIGQQTARVANVVDNPSEAATSLNSEIFDRAARLREAQAQAERTAQSEAEAQRGITADQGQALTSAIRGTAQPIENPREAGEVVGQNVRDAAAANRAEFRARYDEFGRLPGEFRVDAVRGLGTRVRNEMSAADNPIIVDDQLTPAASRAIQALDEMSQPRIQNRASNTAEPNPAEIAGVNLRGIDQMRKKLVAYYQAARTNPTDARATQGIIHEFDGQIERAITEGLFSGDPRALQALQEARASYSRYRQTFGPQRPGDDVGAAMRRIVDRNATPEETANMIIGSGKIGNSGLPVRIADRLEQVLGADSDSWSALRQAMWQKASQVRNGAGQIDPARSAASINDFTGSTLAQRMFTDQERNAMRSHAQGIRDLDRNIEQLPATQGAEQARQAYQDTFGGSELGGAPKAVFQRMVEGTATPEEVANGVFKVIGAGNPGHVTRALQAIERIVGPDSDAMAAVRQGVWQKLTQAAAGKDQPGAQKKMQAINEFLNGTGKTIAEQLYSPKELALMQRYADAIKLTIIPPKAATRSDTAVASFAAARKYAGMVGAALGLLHGDGGLTGYAVGKLLDKAGEKVAGIKDMRKLSDSLENIDRTTAPSSVIGRRSIPSRAVRKEAPFSLNLSGLQGAVPAGADEKKKRAIGVINQQP